MSQKLLSAFVLLLLAAGCGKTETPVAAASSVPVQAATAAPPPSGPPVKVPDLTSAPRFVVDGIVALQEKGFVVAVTTREDADNQPGNIVDQAPDGLASRPKGSVIRLTVATRGQSFELPAEETKKLTAGMAEKLRKKFRGDYEVTVPPVEGQRAIDAMLALQQRGLTINLDVISQPGFRVFSVASQNPAAQAKVPPGTSVEIKCVGRDLAATREEVALLTRENETVLRHALEAMGAVRPGR